MMSEDREPHPIQEPGEPEADEPDEQPVEQPELRRPARRRHAASSTPAAAQSDHGIAGNGRTDAGDFSRVEADAADFKAWVRREITLAASGVDEEERKSVNP